MCPSATSGRLPNDSRSTTSPFPTARTLPGVTPNWPFWRKESALLNRPDGPRLRKTITSEAASGGLPAWPLARRDHAGKASAPAARPFKIDLRVGEEWFMRHLLPPDIVSTGVITIQYDILIFR